MSSSHSRSSYTKHRSHRDSKDNYSSRYRRERASSSSRRSRTPTDRDQWHPYVKDEYNPIVAGSIDGTDTVPHDKAIIRALTSNYRPNKGATGVKRRSVFIGRLSVDTQEADIQSVMEEYGEIVECKLVRDVVTGMSRRYAFVEFAASSQARRLLEDNVRIEIDGSQVLIEPIHTGQLPGWKPRRLGGGLGGWKESGQLRFGGRARPFRKPLVITTEKTKQSSSYEKSKY